MLLIDGDELKSRIVIVINSTVEGDETNDQLRILSMIKHVLETAVEETPIIEAEPVRHGRWDESTVPFCNVCPECGAVVERNCVKCNGSLNRCPNCGAKMDGKEGEE